MSMTDSDAALPRTAIVTGSASGIGAATVLELARQGYSTVGIDIQLAGARAVAEEAALIGGRHLAIHADVSDEPGLVAAFDDALDFLGRLDTLVTCAGVADTTPFMDLDVDTFRRVNDVNLIGTFLCLREAARRMRPGGRLCTVASVAGLRGGGLMGTAAYAASKGAVLALTKNAARSLAPMGLCVNTLAPGATLTPMIAEAWRDPQCRAMVESLSALNRTAEPREMAAAIAFLLSPQASSITGATLVADNGLAMY
jgi:NAD(P)-dependent dehydrogenase (short-subunit alcohol dehydrogenase family)